MPVEYLEKLREDDVSGKNFPVFAAALVAAKQWLDAADLYSARRELPTEMRDEYKQRYLDARSSFRAALADLEVGR